ncbi:DUF6064 family protein [Roseibium salinum]|uniref:DUF6064 family protein n=1 Tax=Roseibium salinum TaxID=1604349 RepID=A0ABT3R755_9HYPH|nr:DUF6064 family protein [Roseibium sp. DSM 29163]MCX2724963.1 DUF6064 family protein [Roseibium sp. DSM 29163]
MSQWWTYRPEDFLLFSEQVYWRLFALTNAAVWPWPVAALALGAAILALAMMRRAVADRLIAAILAAGWLVVAWVFFWSRYRTVNWAASYVAPLFVLEAALLFVIGSMRNNLSFRVTKDPGVILGLLLFVYALAIHPLTALAAGRPLGTSELFAVAPDPTAIGTLGLLAAARGGAERWWLLPVPFLWCLLSWATLETLGTWEGRLVLASAVCALFALLLNRSSARKPFQGTDTGPH